MANNWIVQFAYRRSVILVSVCAFGRMSEPQHFVGNFKLETLNITDICNIVTTICGRNPY